MPLTPSATRDLLSQLNHLPKRFLGQNFLIDGNIVRKSLELAKVSPGDNVIEIGPGLGTLTEALLSASANVWAVEKDRTLFEYLRTKLVPRFPDLLHLIEGDAVQQPLAAYPETDGATFKVVANLPYAISTPWMDSVLEGSLPERMVLMLQQEAAQRYAADPGSKQFGAITIFLRAAYELEPGHRVAGSCFYPKPDVESILLNLVRKESPFVFSPKVKTVIRACFQQRRKQIGSLLRNKVSDSGAMWLASLPQFGLDSKARPEDIPVDAWKSLGLGTP